MVLLVDNSWNEPEEIETGHEDVICARLTHPELLVMREYHVIGAYIPFGNSADRDQAAFARITQLCANLPNPIFLGDLNAHLPSTREGFVDNDQKPANFVTSNLKSKNRTLTGTNALWVNGLWAETGRRLHRQVQQPYEQPWSSTPAA